MTNYTKTMAESLAEVRNLHEDNMDLMKKAVTGSMQTLKMKDGKLKMDKVTASAIMQIFDKVNPANQKKMAKMINDGKKSGIIKLSDFAMSKVTGFKSEEIDLDEGKEKDARQLVDPKKEVLVVKKNSVVVIDKVNQDYYLKHGWSLAEETELDEAGWKVVEHIFGVEFQVDAPEEKPVQTGKEPHVKIVNKLAKKHKLITDHADDLSKFNVKDKVGGKNVMKFFKDMERSGLDVIKKKITDNSKGSIPEEFELDEKTKWKMGDGRPRGGAYIENERFWDLDRDALLYIMKDADTAMKANPTGRKAGKYADEVNDAHTVLGWRKKNGIKEGVELDEAATSKVLAHGGKGQYKVVSGPAKDGSRETVVKFKGKVVSAGDYDSGADGWYMNIKGEKGQKFFDDAQKMADYFAKNKITEEVEVEEGATADARRHARQDKDLGVGKDSADVDDDATDADVKGAEKNIIMQLRGLISLGGIGKVQLTPQQKRNLKKKDSKYLKTLGSGFVQFGKGQEKVDIKVAQSVINKFNLIKKPADKEKFQAQVGKSYKDMLKVLKAGYNEEVELDEAPAKVWHLANKKFNLISDKDGYTLVKQGSGKETKLKAKTPTDATAELVKRGYRESVEIDEGTPDYHVKYAKSKKGPWKVTKFMTLDQAKEFLADVRKDGMNGMISVDGKPIKEETILARIERKLKEKKNG